MRARSIYCKTCDIHFADDIPLNVIHNNHVLLKHEVFTGSTKTTKLDIAKFFNHYLVEPSIWAISLYGIALGLLASILWGFFTLKEYTLGSLVFFLSPAQVQSLDLWYDAYPYSLMIFGSYLLLLYMKFRPTKGYLALPVFLVTYSIWDFLGIGINIIKGYSIIWLGITVISLIYYIPIRKQFSVNISFIGLLIFFGIGVLNIQDILLHYWPLLNMTLNNGNSIGLPFNGILNEFTFCILCLLSIKLKSNDKVK